MFSLAFAIPITLPKTSLSVGAYGTGGLFVRCGSALVLVLLLILVLVLLGIAVLTGVLVLVALVALVAVLILILVLILVHDGHLLLYLRYRDSVTGIGENMHGSAQKNANGGAGVVPEGGIWHNAGIIF